MSTITLSTGSVDAYISSSPEVHHHHNDGLHLSPIMIGVCAAGAGVLLIVIMTILCLIAQRRRDRHSKLKLASTTSSSSCGISDIEHQTQTSTRRLRNGKAISQPFDPRKGEMLINSMPPAAFFDTGSRVTSFISSPPPGLAQPSSSSLPTRRQSNRRNRLQPPIASATAPVPLVTATAPTTPTQPSKQQLSRAATMSSFVPSFVTTTPTTVAADWQTAAAAPSSDLNHHTRSPTSFIQSPTLTSPDSIPIRLDFVHPSQSTNVGGSGDTAQRSAGGRRSSVTLHATHAIVVADPVGQSIPSSPVTARRPEEKVADLVAALERNEAVSVVKRPVPPTF